LTKNIKWNLSVHVEDGPTLTSFEEISAEAVDILNFQVVRGTTTSSPLTVEVQPGNLDNIHFLYIKSDLYKDIKYKFRDSVAAADSDEIVLDKDHIMTSNALIRLFEKPPNQIKFSNESSTTDANIKIVVGRKAT
jgi:hypothetical protein